jgi:hypothetical protein
MSRTVKLGIGTLLLIVAVLAGLAVSQAWREATPPSVYAEMPARIPADVPFRFTLSANRPVTYSVTYDGLTLEQVAQDATFEFLAVAGDQAVDVHAIDGAGLASTYSYEVYGVPSPQPLVRAPEQTAPGEPLSVNIMWAPMSVPIHTLEVSLNGEPLQVFRTDREAVALSTVPLGAPAGERTLSVTLKDEYGRAIGVTRTLMVLPDARPVQELSISSSVLSVSTPENKDLEERALSAAYSSTEHAAKPLWTQPFIVPIDGRSTSGYGTPRRYATGGNVSYHHGADIAAPEGTPIAATNDGVVVIADFFPIKGGLVVIDHGASVFSLYFHQSAINVAAGSRVYRGQIIGEVGSTGLSTGPHLHWEMRVNTISTNPLAWVGKILP